VRGLRWQWIMGTIGIKYSLWRSSIVWSVGAFAAAVTPGKVGDAVRAVYLSRDTGRNFGECFLTVFIDRLLDLVTILVAGVITTLIFSYYYIKLPSVWLVILFVLGILFVLYMLMHRNLMRRLIGPLFRALAPDKYREELTTHFHSFYDSLGVYAREWKKTLIAAVLTLMFWTGVVMLAYTVTWVLGIDVSLRFVFLIMPVVTFVELIPISISGLGTRDATAIYFFSVVGGAGVEAAGFSIMYLLMGTYLTASVGFVAWLLKPAALREKLRS
jgi:uncharacterized protein (TIRG00374 family)